MAKKDYLVDAAKHIRLALEREVSEDYQAAFNYYKSGVDLLLNGVQVDPNKERREAVKRKTTQYLKRAEEIFNSHLQGGLGNGTTRCGGYSSLRLRPIRNLSTPVEDLKMCKVIGVVDKVLTVQSLVTNETFVVKSLFKSSWEAREQPTIIPQGVPFMVKLLRYYVSEDTVYLHLAHVTGGRLFSSLHKAQSQWVKEHPDCCSSNRHRIQMKNSYTSPALSSCWGEEPVGQGGGAAWEEGGGLHTYCEETGCLHRTPNVQAGTTNTQDHPDGVRGGVREITNGGDLNLNCLNIDQTWDTALTGVPGSILQLPTSPECQSLTTSMDPTEEETGRLHNCEPKAPLSPVPDDERKIEEENWGLLSSEMPFEVDGWYLLPRIRSQRPKQNCWQGFWGLPEAKVKVWGAQILLALESLHEQGILCRDLNPSNILLDSKGNVSLTYFGQWSEVQSELSTKAMENMYCAPEIGGVMDITESCDWWSLGALMYELLTGTPLRQSHPTGILPHTQLLIPDQLSTVAASLLTELLQFDAGYRLGSGGGGVSDIKCHPFFNGIQWHTLCS